MIYRTDAGWSSLVARRAHNPKVVGSNPAPATTEIKSYSKATRLKRIFYARNSVIPNNKAVITFTPFTYTNHFKFFIT